MDYGCIYLQVYEDGNIVTCLRTYVWLTTLQWGGVYVHGRFPAREEDLSPGAKRGKCLHGRFLVNKHSVFISLIVPTHTAVQRKAETSITLRGQNIPQQLTHTLSHCITHIQNTWVSPQETKCRRLRFKFCGLEQNSIQTDKDKQAKSSN